MRPPSFQMFVLFGVEHLDLQSLHLEKGPRAVAGLAIWLAGAPLVDKVDLGRLPHSFPHRTFRAREFSRKAHPVSQ